MIVTCAKSNLPILGGPHWKGHPYSKAVLLRAGKPPVAGWYDGDGCLGGLDLRASGALDEIAAGTACMVLGDRYASGDAPPLGRSRIEPGLDRRIGRDFVAACERIGGFGTYEGYALARDGLVPAEIAAALKAESVAAMREMVNGLRQAIAGRMHVYAARGSGDHGHDPGRHPEVPIGIDAIPLDAACRKLRIVGGPGLGPGVGYAEFDSASGDLSPSIDDLAADLFRWYPPRKRANVTLAGEDGQAAAVDLYVSPELGLSAYVSRLGRSVGVHASAEAAVAALGVGTGEAEDLIRAIEAGGFATVRVTPREEMRP